MPRRSRHVAHWTFSLCVSDRTAHRHWENPLRSTAWLESGRRSATSQWTDCQSSPRCHARPMSWSLNFAWLRPLSWASSLRNSFQCHFFGLGTLFQRSRGPLPLLTQSHLSWSFCSVWEGSHNFIPFPWQYLSSHHRLLLPCLFQHSWDLYCFHLLDSWSLVNFYLLADCHLCSTRVSLH